MAQDIYDTLDLFDGAHRFLDKPPARFGTYGNSRFIACVIISSGHGIKPNVETALSIVDGGDDSDTVHLGI